MARPSRSSEFPSRWRVCSLGHRMNAFAQCTRELFASAAVGAVSCAASSSIPAALLAATASEDRGRVKREPAARGGCSQQRRNLQTEAQRALAAALPKGAWRVLQRRLKLLVSPAACFQDTC